MRRKYRGKTPRYCSPRMCTGDQYMKCFVPKAGGQWGNLHPGQQSKSKRVGVCLLSITEVHVSRHSSVRSSFFPTLVPVVWRVMPAPTATLLDQLTITDRRGRDNILQSLTKVLQRSLIGGRPPPPFKGCEEKKRKYEPYPHCSKRSPQRSWLSNQHWQTERKGAACWSSFPMWWCCLCVQTSFVTDCSWPFEPCRFFTAFWKHAVVFDL